MSNREIYRKRTQLLALSEDSAEDVHEFLSFLHEVVTLGTEFVHRFQ
ncbi:MAG: hypothetical protein WAO00_14225 [Chthoniobacterales bacterium]